MLPELECNCGQREREGDCNRGTVDKRVSSPGQTELWCISTPSNASLHTAQHFFTSFYFLIFGGAFSSVQLTHQGYFFWGKPWLYFTFPDQIVWTWMTCASHSKREPCKKHLYLYLYPVLDYFHQRHLRHFYILCKSMSALRRSVKNAAKSYAPCERDVREATSNDKKASPPLVRNWHQCAFARCSYDIYLFFLVPLSHEGVRGSNAEEQLPISIDALSV